MESDATFTVNEIKGIALSIQLPPDKGSPLENVVQTLRTVKFATTKTYVADFTDVVNDMFSKLTFVGTGFAFGLVKEKLTAQFLDSVEFMYSKLDTQDGDSTEILSNENLKLVSSDFNYILGLILGKMNMDSNNLEFTFKIKMSKEAPTTNTLNHLLVSESKTVFGNVEDLKMNGISVQMTENLLDTKVQSKYRINESLDSFNNKNHHKIHAEFKFKSSGPVDFSNLTKDGINRINNLTRSIMRNAHDSRA